MSIVTIDSGTTNTRARVWQNDVVIAQASEAIGVRDTALTGSTDTLIRGVKNVLNQALAQAGIKLDSSVFIIASGMITSNFGLCEIPHLATPVDSGDLAKGMVQKIIPEICPFPIWFIPGVKNHVAQIDISNCDAMDMMRGEETEVIGAMHYFKLKKETLIILPGTHSKFIAVNENQQVMGCASTMAGELLAVLTNNTILTQSLGNQFAHQLDEEYLLQGAESCKNVGLARSCFLVRILSMFSQATENQVANYLLGAVLYSDILTMKNSQALNISPDVNVVVCGKKILRQALALLIQNDDFFQGHVISQDEEEAQPLSGIGAITIARQMSQIHHSVHLGGL